MGRHYHTSSSEEFKFLKDKVVKILVKQSPDTPLKTARAKKQVRKFIKRLREIEKYHEQMGWPHPEAEFNPGEDLKKQLELMKQTPGKPMVTNPDGSLYQKDNLVQPAAGYTISTKGLVKPDGTPFETPIMPGSVMAGGGPGSPHSDEKIKKYLEKQDDGFLRTED